jgi:excisionase family DNA binding protein
MTAELLDTKQEAPAGRLTWTVEEAADVLGISRNGAYEAIREGKIPCVRIGRRVLVPIAALRRMLGEGGAQ